MLYETNLKLDDFYDIAYGKTKKCYTNTFSELYL